MAGKPVLHYFNGRGRMECIRWLLAAAGVEFEEKFIGCPEDLEKLIKDGRLMFQQVPMVEIDGMTLVQTRSILNYIATKYNLYGKDAKERALIDMYTEGIFDLTEMMLPLVICPPDQREAKILLVKDKIKNRYLPAYEKTDRRSRSSTAACVCFTPRAMSTSALSPWRPCTCSAQSSPSTQGGPWSLSSTRSQGSCVSLTLCASQRQWTSSSTSHP
uniref:glutathione S-transferase A2 isoform X1 n=1 Tax=Myodes glareolus TaxID=447135 RepID=UPI002021D45E|nr:glutathione S-transferase A2 isoform X1 [Myodes glareolus]